jgi:hypothetical protein
MTTSIITSHAFWPALKETLNSIFESDYAYEQCAVGKDKIVAPKPFGKDGYYEFTEVAGIGTLQQKDEYAALASDAPRIGIQRRLFPKTFGLEIPISQEALEDGKIEEIVSASKRLRRAGFITQDLDAASLILNHSTSGVISGHDNTTLVSTSHTTLSGSTYSNYLNDTGMTPSASAIIKGYTQAAMLPEPSGWVATDPVGLEAIVCPLAQEHVWKVILGTERSPGNNFNDINTVREFKLKLIPVRHFDPVSTTIWGFKTDAKKGFIFLEKRKIKDKMWTDQKCEVVHHGTSGRWALGWENPRCFILGQA